MRAALIGMALALVACQPGPPQIAAADDSSLSPELRAAYHGLADDLALFVTDTSREPAFPSEWAASLYAALTWIDRFDSDADWTKVRDSFRRGVSSIDFSLVGRRIQIATTKQLPWTEPWSRGEPLTGNPSVDALMTRFGLTVARGDSYLTDHDYWDLTTAETKVHTRAVAALFEPLDGVVEVSPDPDWTLYKWGNAWRLWGFESSLWIRPSPGTGWRLDIGFGWGDCAAGCIYGHTFSFAVGPSGSVTLSQRGTPLP
jgi:hypothetical protein